MLDAGMICVDADDVITYVSERMCAMLGYSINELLGRKPFEFVLEEMVEREFIARSKRGVIEAHETAFKRKDGETVWMAACAKPFFENGMFLGGVGLFTDITERKRIANALKESEEQYRLLVKYAPVGIYEMDFNSLRLKNVNDAMCRILGYTREELLNVNPNELLDEDSRKRFDERIMRGINGENIDESVELHVKKKDGAWIWGLFNIKMQYKDGLNSVIVIMHDITERKKVEEALRQSEEKLRTFVQQSLDGFVIIDENGVIIEWNHGEEEITGIPRTEAVGKHQWDVQYRLSPNKDITINAIKRAREITVARFAAGDTQELIFDDEILRPDGKMRVMQSVLFPLRIGKRMLIGVISRDITERKIADDAVRKSEARFRTVFENCRDAIIVTDTTGKGKIISVNAAATKMFGWTEDEMVGLERKDILIIDKHLAKGLEERDRSGVMRAELTYKRKDGSTFEGELTSGTFLESKGRIYAISIIRDITERKRVKKKLERHRKILEGINTIFEKALTSESEEDVGETCLSVAEKLTGSRIGFIGEIRHDGRLYDFAMSEATRNTCRMVFKSDGHNRIMGNFPIKGLYGYVLSEGKSLIANEPSSHPCSAGLPEGHLPLYSFLGVPMFHGGKVFGMIAMGNRPGGYRAEDCEVLEALAPAIVEAIHRKRAESSLKRTIELLNNATDIAEDEAARLDAVFNSMADGLLIFDENENCILGNAVAMRLLRIPENMMPLPIAKIAQLFKLFDEDGKQINARMLHLNKPLKGETLHNIPLLIEHDDGTRLLISVSCSPIISKGKIDGVVLTFTDVTATKAIERERMKLAEIDRMRNDFLDMFGHELRTPLTPLKMYTSLMRKGRLGTFSDKELKRIDDMNANLEHLNGLITEMLDYTRAKMRPLEISTKEQSLFDVAKEVVDSFKTSARAHKISMKLDCKGNTKGQFDTGMMKKAITNLISNAIKYSEEGGKVAVSVNGGRGNILVTVSDTGIGISETNLAHLFEKYYTIDTSLTRSRDQLGLGLYIAKTIVEQHGGAIWVKSKVGKGSSFYFKIPKRQKRQKLQKKQKRARATLVASIER